MALSKRTSVDQITVDEYGNTMIRERTDIRDGDEVVASTYHRRVIAPKDSLAKETARVRAIAEAGRKEPLGAA